MLELLGIPWIQEGSIIGVLGSLLVFLVVQIIRGELVPRSRVQLLLDAWKVSMDNQDKVTEMVRELTTITDTLEHLIESLPRLSHEDTDAPPIGQASNPEARGVGSV